MPKRRSAIELTITPGERIEKQIYLIRGQKVMLDSDLDALYQVTTGNLNLAVRRNRSRFPKDFMFQLNRKENDPLLLQFARANKRRGGRRTSPYVFTEHGVAMLSAVLNTERAVQMSILIVRAFVRLRELIATNKDLAARIEKLEAAQETHASVIDLLAQDIDQLKQLPPEPLKNPIGFRPSEE